jgi:transporter family protein
MWLILAFVSATFLGFYDTSKKASLKNNAVLPVLLLNTIFSTLIFSPFLIDYLTGAGWFAGTFLDTTPYTEQAWQPNSSISTSYPIVDSPEPGHRLSRFSLIINELSATGSAARAHLMVILKAFIVLSSWIMGYFGLKHLPLTLVGPINATRPVLVLVGAMLIFGERLNAYQWVGVLLAILSIYMMSRAGKKENIDFRSNRWIWCVAGATVMGAISGLYDKHIMKSLSPMFVQSWFNFYQMIIMAFICALIWYPKRHQTTPFRWSWAIPLISIFICIGDFAYFTSLNDAESMISVVSLVRRSSVIISFACGAIIFKERNLRAKALDLILILIGMAFIWMGTVR